MEEKRQTCPAAGILLQHLAYPAIAISILLSVSCSTLAKRPSPEYKGTLLPSESPPDFIKKQWEDIAANGQFPRQERTWREVGLPPGLEKQVWDAWAPGAGRKWKNVDPGYTNVTYDFKVDNGVVSLVLDLGGLVQSKDGGKTWRPVSHHLSGGPQSYSFDISPVNPDIMAVAGHNIDRSLNGGRSWQPVMDEALPLFVPHRVIPGKRHKDKDRAFGAIRFNADGSRVFAALGALGHGFGARYGLEPEMARHIERKFIYSGNGDVCGFSRTGLGPFAGIRYILPHFSNPDLVYFSFADGTIYICRNAASTNPVYTELSLPDSMKGFQVIDMDVSPNDPGQLLLSMMEQTDQQNNFSGKTKLILAEVSGDKLSAREIDYGRGLLASAKWNPRHPEQVFLGLRWGAEGNILVSDDGMKTFEARPFPKELFHDEPGAPNKTFAGYGQPRKLAFDRKSDLAITTSVTGAWMSRDGFRTMEDLVMTYDPATKLYGNKGIGFAECGASVAIRDKNTYLATNDHAAWRSNGKDTSKWLRISSNPGMPRDSEGEAFRGLAFPMFVSDDEQYVYLIAKTGYMYKNKGTFSHYAAGMYRLMLSTNQGDSWEDVTKQVGLEDDSSDGELPDVRQIFFDPADSRKQWILLKDNSLLISADGGATFEKVNMEGIRAIRDNNITIVYDSPRKTMYTIAFLPEREGTRVVRSLDLGRTWNVLPFPESINFYSAGVLANGDLVLSDDGRLMVIPYAKIPAGKIEQSMIRMTTGGTLGETAYGLRTFKPIFCRGMNIITFPQNGWNYSAADRNLGPLLSRDGGKTFLWIVYDFQRGSGSSVDMRDGKIIVGTSGTHILDLADIE